MLRRLIFTPLLTLLLTGTLVAQDIELSLADGHSMTIEGTSNVRDWEADVTQMESRFILNGFTSESLEGLSPKQFGTLEIRMPVEAIDTDTRRLTRNLHDYLKADEHPVITFELNRVTNIDVAPGGESALIQAEGVITAAGSSHATTLEVTAVMDAGNALTITGSQPLKMTDFGIDPPRALMGTIRAVDEITIHYHLRFHR